jgi:hypothetical protein
MATEADYILLRQESGATTTQVSDALAETFFVASLALYPANADAAYAYTRVRALRIVWGEASSQADYTENEESERLGQLAEAKRKLLEYWEGKLADAIADVELPIGRRAAFFGLAKAPARRWYPIVLLVAAWGIDLWRTYL